MTRVPPHLPTQAQDTMSYRFRTIALIGAETSTEGQSQAPVVVGSNSGVRMLDREVGFALNNGHHQPSVSGPKSATSRPWPYRPEADVCIWTGARTWTTVAENGGNMAGTRVPLWTRAWPAAACGILLVAPFLQAWVLAAIAGIVVFGTVFAAVHHAEVVAHKVGEPFGTLILALAVTVIETALIVSVMISAPSESAGLARDTVFAAVMIVCNGIVGLCLLMGGARYREQEFQVHGASAAMAVLAVLTSLTLILPNFAARELGPLYSRPQLVFAGLVSLVLYGSFVFVQTIRHRDYFLPETADEETHVPPPSNKMTYESVGLLIVSLIAIVGLAKILTPTVEAGIANLHMPKSTVGIRRHP